jgi:tetraacyldisaccharide 4'-kinase
MTYRHQNWPRPILAWLAKCYSLAVRVRLTLYRTHYLKSKRLGATTISVGNIAVGGTGKTPLVEYLARYLTNRGYSVAILTRGYGRKHARERQLVSDGQRILNDATLAGDEPLLLARRLPGVVIIAEPDRYSAGKWAEREFGVDLHLLDDAFQYLELERDVNFLVVDARDPFGGERPLPAGRLREPLSEIARAGAIIVTGSDHPFDQMDLEAKIQALAGQKPIFYAYRDLIALRNPLTGDTAPPQRLINQFVSAVCAIGQPEHFFEDVRHFQANIVHQRVFPDHHQFSQKEIQATFAQARAAGARWLLTTEKDWVRMERLTLPSEPALWVAQSELRILEEAKLLSFLLQSIEGETLSPPPSRSATTSLDGEVQ